MGSSDKQLECMICLSDFHANFAHIPELDCSCTIIVHEECWEHWSGRCLYCRNTNNIVVPAPINRPTPLINKLKTMMAYIIWAILFIIYFTLIYDYVCA